MNKRILALLAALCLLLLAACRTVPSVSEPSASEPSQSTVVTTVNSTAPSDETAPAENDSTTAAPTEGPSSTSGTGTTKLPTTKPIVLSGIPSLPPVTLPTTVISRTATTATTTRTTDVIRPSHTHDVVDLNGYEFKYANSWLNRPWDQDVTLIEQSLFERAWQVEEETNCKINFTSFYLTAETMKPFALANRFPADAVESMVPQIYVCAAQGYLESFDPYIENGTINLTEERWMQPYTALGISPLDGKQYGLRFIRPTDVGYVVFYNRTLLAKVGISSEVLNENAWTFRELQQYSLAATSDTDNDGLRDTYGIVGSFDTLAFSFALAGGGSLVTVKDGKAVNNTGDASLLDGLTFLDQLINQDCVVYFPDGAYREVTSEEALKAFDPVEFFLEGNTAFLFAQGRVAEQHLRPNAKFDYGIMPLPMGPYAFIYTSPAPETLMTVLPQNNKNLDKAVFVLNKLADYTSPIADAEYVYSRYFQTRENDDGTDLLVYYICNALSTVDLGFGVTPLCEAFEHQAKRSILWKQNSIDDFSTASEAFQKEIDAVYN